MLCLPFLLKFVSRAAPVWSILKELDTSKLESPGLNFEISVFRPQFWPAKAVEEHLRPQN